MTGGHGVCQWQPARAGPQAALGVHEQRATSSAVGGPRGRSVAREVYAIVAPNFVSSWWYGSISGLRPTATTRRSSGWPTRRAVRVIATAGTTPVPPPVQVDQRCRLRGQHWPAAADVVPAGRGSVRWPFGAASKESSGYRHRRTPRGLVQAGDGFRLHPASDQGAGRNGRADAPSAMPGTSPSSTCRSTMW